MPKMIFLLLILLVFLHNFKVDGVGFEEVLNLCVDEIFGIVVVVGGALEVGFVAGLGVVEDEILYSNGKSSYVLLLFVEFWLSSDVYFVYIFCCLKYRFEHVMKINREQKATEIDARVFII